VPIVVLSPFVGRATDPTQRDHLSIVDTIATPTRGEMGMGLQDEIEKMLHSRPRNEDATVVVTPDIENLRQAVRELQEAVIAIARAFDERTEGEWPRV
jgi:hypothetical protein